MPRVVYSNISVTTFQRLVPVCNCPCMLYINSDRRDRCRNLGFRWVIDIDKQFDGREKETEIILRNQKNRACRGFTHLRICWRMEDRNRVPEASCDWWSAVNADSEYSQDMSMSFWRRSCSKCVLQEESSFMFWYAGGTGRHCFLLWLASYIPGVYLNHV